MKAVIVIIIIITTVGFLCPLANRLSKISEPIGDLSNIPVATLGISADLSGAQGKIKTKITYIPISRARAERTSMVGVEVCLYNCFKASSWYGSGRERRGREKVAELPYGVVFL